MSHHHWELGSALALPFIKIPFACRIGIISELVAHVFIIGFYSKFTIKSNLFLGLAC
jgi:hypothetical protein